MRNRFKGLDLIDKLPDELWMEVCDIVQEMGIKTIPKKKICRKVKVKSLSRIRLLVSPWTACSLPGSSVHGIFQARLLEWVAIAISERFDRQSA